MLEQRLGQAPAARLGRHVKRVDMAAAAVHGVLAVTGEGQDVPGGGLGQPRGGPVGRSQVPEPVGDVLLVQAFEHAGANDAGVARPPRADEHPGQAGRIGRRRQAQLGTGGQGQGGGVAHRLQPGTETEPVGPVHRAHELDR